MNPHFFGSSERPLYGVYQPPVGRSARDLGVLICSPIGHEYLRTHWAVRQLAGQLSRGGAHVLRFDYTGTGDSWGDLRNASLDVWTQDIRTAMQDLQDESGVSHVAVVGLRMGATLATFSGVKADSFVLWDPVIDGHDYVEQLRKMHRQYLVEHGSSEAANQLDGEELLGFVFPPSIVLELETIDLWESSRPAAKAVSVIASSGSALISEIGWRWEPADVEVVDDAGHWGELAQAEAALLAGRITRAISDRVLGATTAGGAL